MGFAVAQRQPVHRRAMGMAVDHPVHVVAQHGLLDRLRVDVHDGFRLVLVGLLAAGAHFGGDLQSPAQRQRQEQFLNQRVVHFTAELLIGAIVGAQGVAVQDQDPAAVQLQHFLFRQQLHAAGAGEAFAEQKIAVAVDEVAGHAGLLQRFQRRGDLRVQRLGIVVADPGFKQVAKDVQRVGVHRFAP